MVGSSNQNAVRRKIVKLQKQGRHDPLDLAGFVKIAAFLSDGIKFIEEEDTGFGTHKIEEASQSLGGLTQVARYDGVISNGEQRQRKFEGEALGKRCLAVSRWADQQHPVTWLQAVGTQDFCSSLLFDKFLTCALDSLREKQTGQRSFGVTSLNAPGPITDTQATLSGRAGTRRPQRRGKRTLDPFGNNGVLLGALVRCDRFGSHTGRFLVSANAGLDKVDDEIASGHGRS